MTDIKHQERVMGAEGLSVIAGCLVMALAFWITGYVAFHFGKIDGAADVCWPQSVTWQKGTVRCGATP